MDKHKLKQRILLVLTILTVAFIFIHSLMPGTVSANESNAFFGFFSKIVKFLHLPSIFNDHTIRKLAHFVEFSVFGFLLSYMIHEYKGRFKSHIYTVLFFILSVPVIDECIQFFSEGRTSRVLDVVIDFCGGLFGFILLFAIVKIRALVKKKKSDKQNSRPNK